MANVFRKQTTRIHADGSRTVERSAKWYGTVNGKHVPLTHDKRNSEQLLRTMEVEALKGNLKIGPSNPITAKLTLAEHINDFRESIADRHTARQARLAARWIQRVCDALGWTKVTQLNAEAASRWIAGQGKNGPATVILPSTPTEYRPSEAAELLGITTEAVGLAITRNGLTPATGNGKARRITRDTVQALLDARRSGIGPRTRNDGRVHLKHFGKWLLETGRVMANPFARGLDAEKTEADIRKRRRALEPAEMQSLFDATRTGPDRYDLTGPARSLLYAVAYVTGFRRGALAKLTPAQFDLDAEYPTVTLTAKTSKNHKSQVNPLSVDLADELRKFLTGHPAKKLLWPGRWVENSAKMIRADLDAAGIAINLMDAHGTNRLDFHCLRHSALTHAARSAPLHVVQKLAGHSSPTVTAKYTHATNDDLRTAIGNFSTRPALNPAIAQTDVISRCTPVAQTERFQGQSVTSSDNNTTGIVSEMGTNESLKTVGNVNNLQFESTSDRSSPGWIRTNDQPINSLIAGDSKALPDIVLTSNPSSRCTPVAQLAANTLTVPTPADPSNLARLLGELAALPPEQRTALAALLGSMPSTSAPPPAPPRLDDRCPLDRPEGKPTGQ